MTTPLLSRIRWLMSSCIGVATLSLCAGVIGSSWYAALIMLGVGLLWLSVLRHGRGWVADWALFVFVVAAIWAGLQGAAWGWQLTAVVAGLAGWNLTHYLAHLQAAPERPDEDELVRRHLLRLAAVTGIGWLLAALALAATIQINYIGAILLAGIAIILLTRSVRALRRRSA